MATPVHVAHELGRDCPQHVLEQRVVFPPPVVHSPGTHADHCAHVVDSRVVAVVFRLGLQQRSAAVVILIDIEQLTEPQ